MKGNNQHGNHSSREKFDETAQCSVTGKMCISKYGCIDNMCIFKYYTLHKKWHVGHFFSLLAQLIVSTWFIQARYTD